MAISAAAAAATTAARMSTHMPGAPVRLFENVHAFRAWRRTLFHAHKSVGFVPTMGALHDGHLALVDASLRENDYTVVSIFVNPAQFAPHEDLASYPRTLHTDQQLLAEREQAAQAVGRLAVLVPQVSDMYPHGITQDVSQQVGAFVEVKGLSHQMEGTTRPSFFRGVSTVVTKLLNVVMPDRAYFGQKDIQQAIVIRRLVDDLLFSYPQGAKRVRVLPTARDPRDQLALSSRNKYLDAHGRAVAPLLYRALCAGEAMWASLRAQGVAPEARVQPTLSAARAVILQHTYAPDEVARCELDYISLNDTQTLEPLTPEDPPSADAAILSGAMWVRNHAGASAPAARLIDNVLLDYTLD